MSKLKIIRKSDNKIFDVFKYIFSEDIHNIWCNDWYGRHVIGQDCEFYAKSYPHNSTVTKYLLDRFNNSDNPEYHNLTSSEIDYRAGYKQALKDIL